MNLLKSFRYLSILAVAVPVGLAACNEPRTETVRVRETEPLRFHSPVERGGLLPVPDTILAAEDRAVLVFHAGEIRDWDRAAHNYDRLVEVAQEIPADSGNAVLRQQLATTLRSLDDAIEVRDVSSTMNYANDATALTAQLADPYRKEVPTEVKMMGFYARRLEIGVAEGNVGKLRETAIRMGAMWQRLRPLVAAREGNRLSSDFGQTVSELLIAQQVREFIPLVGPAQQQANEMDMLFRTTDAP